jgi:pyruvate ferredoxin oxidoreductase gamma subunit
VDAQQIAMACKTRVNMVMLGALARAAAFIPLEALEAVVRDTVGQKYPQALAGNLEGIRRGWEEARGVKIPPDPGFPPLPFRELEQELGWKTAPEGGVVTRYGSTVASDVSAGREGYVPVFKKEACIHCGLCDSTCPDMVFQFAPGEYKGKPAMTNLGPDYHHCKGCLRCTKICPTDALTPGLERDQDLTRTHVRNRDLRPDKMEFEDAGANSWMESESATVNEVY